MDSPRILVLGANGQVGWELQQCLAPIGEVVAATREGQYGYPLDLSDLSATNSALTDLAPDIIINAAAYTAVDKAEDEQDQAVHLNAELPQLLAEWTSVRTVPVIHYSTDYVFDGSKQTPYSEEDVPNPLSVYGQSKLAGDKALLEMARFPFIFRVSWVYSARRNNFLLTMLRLLKERDELKIVDDQWGAPTWSRDIAQTTGLVVHALLHDSSLSERAKGLYHLSPTAETTWYDFACSIQEKSGIECRLQAIPSSQYPTAAVRPANSRLNSDKISKVFGLRLPHWERSLAACIESMERPE